METTLENKLDIDLHTATSEQVYNEVGRIWQELGKLFGRERPGKLPFVAINDGSGNPDIDFYPEPPVTTSAMIRAHIDTQRAGSYYISGNHTLILKRGDSYGALVEEATHAFLYPEKPIVEVSVDELLYYTAKGKICKALYRVLKSHGKTGFQVNTAEFFPPLAIKGITGASREVRWNRLTRYKKRQWDSREVVLKKQVATGNFLGHLPARACDILVQNYDGDVKRLLQEHPQLPYLDGQQLWRKYCLPLLVSGKVEGVQKP